MSPFFTVARSMPPSGTPFTTTTDTVVGLGIAGVVATGAVSTAGVVSSVTVPIGVVTPGESSPPPHPPATSAASASTMNGTVSTGRHAGQTAISNSRRTSLSEVLRSVDAFRSPTISAQLQPVGAGRELLLSHAGEHDLARRHLAAVLDRLGAGDVDDRDRGRQDDVRCDHGAGADPHALDDHRARADEGAVLDDHGRRLRRLEHAADADAAREVDVRADLRTRADRRPRVHHRPRPDPGADVHVAGHEDAALGKERAVARHARRDDADAAVGIVRLDGDLVEELEAADVHRLDLANAEVEQDRLLDPLVHLPATVDGLGDADRAGVEERDRLLDGGGVERARLPHPVDLLRKLHCR